MNAPLLGRPSTGILRMAVLVCLSVALMIADQRSDHVRQLRSGLGAVAAPLHYLVALPGLAGDWMRFRLTEHEAARQAYLELEAQHATLRSRLLRLESLEAENEHLRSLLGAHGRSDTELLLASILDVELEPFSQKFLVNRGLIDGIYVGQSVVDADGLVGQVTQVMPFTSAVTLITDPVQAVPVMVQRNGLRAIVFGAGRRDRISVPYLARNADIREGDVLVTSGIGGRVPAGYPVARVEEIVRDPNEAFLSVRARPIARLEHAAEVLLLWQDGPERRVTETERGPVEGGELDPGFGSRGG